MVFKVFPYGRVVQYAVFMVFPLPQTLVKALAKNQVKNLAKNLVKGVIRAFTLDLNDL